MDLEGTLKCLEYDYYARCDIVRVSPASCYLLVEVRVEDFSRETAMPAHDVPFYVVVGG